jgi:hypothetical protein
MQQGRNRLILVAVVRRQEPQRSSDANVWDGRAFSRLSTMQLMGIPKGLIKSVCQQ